MRSTIWNFTTVSVWSIEAHSGVQKDRNVTQKSGDGKSIFVDNAGRLSENTWWVSLCCCCFPLKSKVMIFTLMCLFNELSFNESMNDPSASCLRSISIKPPTEKSTHEILWWHLSLMTFDVKKTHQNKDNQNIWSSSTDEMLLFSCYLSSEKWWAIVANIIIMLVFIFCFKII